MCIRDRYCIEAFLKILFYGKEYFKKGWNLYDFICICGILVFRIFFAAVKIDHDPIIILLTLFRIAKLMSLFRLLKFLRRMFQTMVLATPAAINLAILVILVNYVFAVVGVIFFSTTKLQNDLNGNANFKNLIVGFLTTFRIAAGDSWAVLGHDLMRTKTQYFECMHSPKYEDIQLNGGETNGCGNLLGVIYVCIIVLVMNFIFLNLFMAIVVASMLEISDLSDSVLSDKILHTFQHTWSKYDPDASGLLEYSELWNFLCDLRKPLGVCEEDMPNSYYSAITLWMLDLKIYYHEDDPKHYVEFYDVLEALVKKSIYRPQTLNMIFNNESKDELIDGLQKLWAEKSSLLIEDQEELGKVEALNYYYDAKLASAREGLNQLKKAQLSSLVWHTLRISMTLKRMVKKRKGLLPKSSTNVKWMNSEDSLPPDVIVGETSTQPMLRSGEVNQVRIVSLEDARANKCEWRPSRKSGATCRGNSNTNGTAKEENKSSTQSLTRNEEAKTTIRAVRDRLPVEMQKIESKILDGQSRQNLLHSSNGQQAGSSLNSSQKKRIGSGVNMSDKGSARELRANRETLVERSDSNRSLMKYDNECRVNIGKDDSASIDLNEN
eukprot:TRINITY_DN4808_c0_g1_i12.p1 TRINITY_DN4808_c0_g1~~TRINITY_DN4808_c0_g1_i12.p1  ORF type:complete len:608 (-),score=171.08 TRINITY_DN4808_c0_g1_i12:156-1979(-)